MSDLRHKAVDAIKAAGIVAVVRTPTPEQAVKVVRALAMGGVIAAEVTFTVPNAADAIAELAADRDAGRMPGGFVLGAGTVVTEDQANAAVDAGATYLVSPHLSLPVVGVAAWRNVAALPGAFTPSEVFAAHQAGGDIIKIFPAARLGPAYFKDLAGPYPKIPLMPTGGVSAANVGEWLDAGAVAVGVGGELVDKKAIAAGDYGKITEKARELVDALNRARRA